MGKEFGNDLIHQFEVENLLFMKGLGKHDRLNHPWQFLNDNTNCHIISLNSKLLLIDHNILKIMLGCNAQKLRAA